MREVYISLGGNLGQREKTLRRALERLHGTEGIRLCRVSGFFETAPWGKKDQPPFVNAAAMLRTELEPLELLEVCQRIEEDLGRVRHEHWGARTIDLDLLHIPGISLSEGRLILPHPHMLERAFVLLPLAEIAPELMIGGASVREHLRVCRDTGEAVPCPGSPVDISLKLLACVDAKGGLGKDGELLFHLGEDMAFFRRQTWGRPVIMGRRTMDSIGKPLEGRRNLVLSRRCPPRKGFELCPSMEELWQALEGQREACVIGGGEIYRELLPYCREAFITRVAAQREADAFLPELSDFSLRGCRPAVDRATGMEMEFCHYVHRGGNDGNF